jgi:hypothetical protein
MSGILVPEKDIPVCKLTIKFSAPGSAMFDVSVEGQMLAGQKFVAAGWLGSRECVAFVAIHSTDLAESVLTLDFGQPASSEFTPELRGRVTRNQLYLVEKWLTWSAELDFTANLQRQAMEAQANLQRNQQILQGLGRSRTH